MVIRRRETIPVPMVTENHEGEKLRTTRRQPVSYLEGREGDCDDCPSLVVVANRVSTLPDELDGESGLPALLRERKREKRGREDE